MKRWEICLFVFRSEQGAKKMLSAIVQSSTTSMLKRAKNDDDKQSIGNIEATEVILEHPSIIFLNDDGG